MIHPHHGRHPVLASDVFVAPSADIIGDVTIGPESSVWFQVVIRGDVNGITIGARTNIQDHSMLHVSRPNIGLPGKEAGSPLAIGNDVTIGHRVTLHGCTVGNRVVNFVHDSPRSLIGRFVELKIIGATGLSLQGELVSHDAHFAETPGLTVPVYQAGLSSEIVG